MNPLVLRRRRRRRCRALVSAAAAVLLGFVLFSPAARAGLVGQPKPSAAVVARIQKDAADILGTGSLAMARPDLYLAVEDNATSDLTDLLAQVVRDDTTYNGLLDTLEEAARTQKSAINARFARYNLARLHLLRARQAVRGALGGPRDVLAAALPIAQKLADDPAVARDPAAVELLGDVYAEQNSLENARAAYEKIGQTDRPAPAAYAQFKIGQMYQRALQLGLAEAAYRRAAANASAATGTPGDLVHSIYQNLAAVYVRRASYAAAAEALQRSARVSPPDTATAPFKPRTDVAQSLLDLGYAREVSAYASAALRLSPGDDALRRLQQAANARLRTAPGRR